MVSKWMIDKLVNVVGFVINNMQILVNVIKISDDQIILLIFYIFIQKFRKYQNLISYGNRGGARNLI